jgi:hypothetical protein
MKLKTIKQMKLNEFKNKLNDMLGDKHINISDNEDKKVSKKEDLLQQKKVLNNIFDIYSDALLNKIKE